MKFKVKFICFFFILISFAGLSYQYKFLDLKLLVVSLLVLISFAITCLSLFFGKKGKYLSFIQVAIILIICISILFPFHTANPYTIFSLQSFKIICFAAIAQLLLVIQFRDDLDEKIFFLLSLALLVGANTFFILFDWREMPSDDIARHSGNALHIFDLLQSNMAGKFFIAVSFYDFYQPLTYLVSLPFVLLFGKSNTSLLLSFSLLWLPLGYYYMHKFLVKFIRLENVYATSICFCIFGSVMASSMMRQYMLDFPCLCMVILYNYAIAKSFYLKYRKESFIAGLIFGLGLLTKASFLSLAVIPFVIAIVRKFSKEYKNNFNEPNRFISNILMHVLGIFLGGGFWYIINISHFSYELPTVTTWFGEHEGDPVPSSFASLVWYFKRFFYYFSPPVFSTLLIGIGLSCYNLKKKLFFNLIFLFSILVAYAAATMTWNKDSRTLLPLLAYFPFGFIGLFKYLPLKKIVLPLICFLLTWTTVYNLKFAAGQEYSIGESLMPLPYTMSGRLSSPAENDYREAGYIYKKLFTDNFSDSIIPTLNIPSGANLFTDHYYKSLYKEEKKFPLQFAGSDKIYYFRDYFWRDYYLYRAKLDTSSFSLEEIANKSLIRGDMICTIVLTGKNGGRTTSEFSLPPSSPKLKIALSDNVKKISFSLRVHHSGPSGQYVQFVYDMLGKNYDRFNVPLICLTLGSDVKEVPVLNN